MNCTLTVALISETQEGNIGEDWKYHLTVKAFEDDLDGEASISVPKHSLPSGEIREPFGSPAPVTVFSGECKSGFLVRMKLTATLLVWPFSGFVNSSMNLPVFRSWKNDSVEE